MKQLGLTCRWIPSQAAFNKLSIRFNIILLATLFSLRMIWSSSEFIDFANFEFSKVSFREAMGFAALMMAVSYHTGSVRWILNEVLTLEDQETQIR
ncbi:hypothetical protein CARUB_v10019132mg, partial [Capsella rubella]